MMKATFLETEQDTPRHTPVHWYSVESQDERVSSDVYAIIDHGVAKRAMTATGDILFGQLGDLVRIACHNAES